MIHTDEKQKPYYFGRKTCLDLLSQRDLLICKILRAMKGALTEYELVRLPFIALNRRIKSLNQIIEEEQPEIDYG